MKFITQLLILLSFLTCSANRYSKLDQFQIYILTLDEAKYYSTTIAANKYKEIFSNEKVGIRDSAFVLFEIFYDKVHSKINELHHIEDTDYFTYMTANDRQKIPDMFFKYKNDLIENGFDIAITVGDTWIKKNRDFISKNFYDYVSPEMKKYCTFINILTKEETLNDAAFTISPTRLAERIIWLENFKNINPTFLLIDEVNQYYRVFLYLLMKGSENTDIFNFEKNILL